MVQNYTDDEILKIVSNIVKNSSPENQQGRNISSTTDLIRTLKYTSFNMQEMIFKLEQRFDIKIYKKDSKTPVTVQDCVNMVKENFNNKASGLSEYTLPDLELFGRMFETHKLRKSKPSKNK